MSGLKKSGACSQTRVAAESTDVDLLRCALEIHESLDLPDVLGPTLRPLFEIDLHFVTNAISRNAHKLVTEPTRLFDIDSCFPMEGALAIGEPLVVTGCRGPAIQTLRGTRADEVLFETLGELPERAVFAVVDRAGLHLARYAVDIALDRPVAVQAPRIGTRYAWTTGDLEGLGAAVRELGPRGIAKWVLDIARSALAADVHVTWSWRDPLPTVVALWHAMCGPMARLVKALQTRD